MPNDGTIILLPSGSEEVWQGQRVHELDDKPEVSSIKVVNKKDGKDGKDGALQLEDWRWSAYVPLPYTDKGGTAVSLSDEDFSALTWALSGLEEVDQKELALQLPLFCRGCSGSPVPKVSPPAPTAVTSPTLTAGVTLFIPYVSDFRRIRLQVTDMQHVADALFGAAPTSSGTSAAIESTSAGLSSITPSSDPAATSSPTTSSSTAVSKCSLTDGGRISSPCETTLENGENVLKKSEHAATTQQLAGGIVGILIAGVVACALLLWLLRRHRRQKHAALRSTMRDEHSPDIKEMQNLATPLGVTGWQKHLPQEKDDGTIARTVKSIFDQVQVHMEGFYKARPGKMNGEAVAAIEGVSSVDLAKKLSKAPNGVLMLEAILIRWIVHRMSLRSVAAESFLPIEYTKIPEQNGWYMESDEHGNGHAAEAKKGRSQSATHILSHLY
jgi:hypothetical protein